MDNTIWLARLRKALGLPERKTWGSNDGMAEDDISRRFDEIWRVVNRVESIVCGNGRPGLREDFLSQLAILRKEMAVEINRAEKHSKLNMQQGDLDSDQEIKRIESKVDKMDERNGKKIDKLTWIVTLGTGAILTIQFLNGLGILHLNTK